MHHTHEPFSLEVLADHPFIQTHNPEQDLYEFRLLSHGFMVSC